MLIFEKNKLLTDLCSFFIGLMKVDLALFEGQCEEKFARLLQLPSIMLHNSGYVFHCACSKELMIVGLKERDLLLGFVIFVCNIVDDDVRNWYLTGSYS